MCEIGVLFFKHARKTFMRTEQLKGSCNGLSLVDVILNTSRKPQDNLIQELIEVSNNTNTELPQSTEAPTTSSAIEFADTFPELFTSNASTISPSDGSESALLGGGNAQPMQQSGPFRCSQCEKVFPKQSKLKRTTYRTIATAATKGSLSEETSIAIAKLGTQFIIVDTSVHFSAANIALLMGAVGSADGIISNDILGACTATSVHKYSRVIANDIVKDGVEVVEVA
ncbi:hypothetical protein OIDMADRAFT_52787 [Oidiodendron maius Zn]|uniref:Uncharacterized protein n=1 Tax=Oidiodendron maius (strain Zn) TaxID=913774 RepID=A0A0C3CVD7_OIDMZ|nr:hypothetical protein OIDMADRAFT_52787 [Oidiodendron maius Zn]